MWDTVAVVGVGLIGGSIGLALRDRALAKTVVGIGRTEHRLQIALERGAISRFSTDLQQGVAEAQLVVVCTPVGHIVEHVRRISLACPAGTLITDAGSTKGEICRALASNLDGEGHFIGSHPMAGSEKSGPEHAEANLFQGSVTVVTPTENAVDDDTVRIEDFWSSIGSRVVRMTADEHDQAVATVSHLPHMVASALAAGTPPDQLLLAAGGWRDTTRVASGDVELWRQILTDNRVHVLQALSSFEKVLSEFRDALERNEAAAITRLLASGKQNRDSLGS
jgi:prephenate dehydrogenase